jgi:hypothetical protein
MRLLLLYKETVSLLLELNKRVCVCVCVCVRVCEGQIRNFLNFKRWTLEGYYRGTARVNLSQSDANGGSKQPDLSCGAL